MIYCATLVTKLTGMRALLLFLCSSLVAIGRSADTDVDFEFAVKRSRGTDYRKSGKMWEDTAASIKAVSLCEYTGRQEKRAKRWAKRTLALDIAKIFNKQRYASAVLVLIARRCT